MKSETRTGRAASHPLARVACALALLTATMAWADPATLGATAEVEFKAKSTLHDFRGHVASQPFPLSIVETGGKRTWSAEAEVTVGDMDTKNKGRDEHMRDMFNEKLYPRIKAVIENAEVPSTNHAVKTTLKLRIRDKEQSIPVLVTDWKEDADGVRFHAAFDVSLKAFGLKAPPMLGLIRVGDCVKVVGEVTARSTH